ncbi:MAG TPA: hypothetical protein VMV59_03260 [Candidatus Dormibacteraeota bacterium]|nr:hypothetical protein [Candidatus Dormibacteraeota bacterium]
MRQARGVSLQGARQEETERRYKREYMRRWRANPENRARVMAMRHRQCAKRKVERSQEADAKVCAFCRTYAPVKRIERLITTSAGFKAVYVMCCADCLV